MAEWIKKWTTSDMVATLCEMLPSVSNAWMARDVRSENWVDVVRGQVSYGTLPCLGICYALAH